MWWLADPATLLSTIYKGLVRSHLNYGGIFLSPITKKNQYKMDKIQFEALRVVTKSTPTNLLLSECAEIALEHRIYLRAVQFEGIFL